MHGRQQIRDALATALTGLATTSTRVFVSHTYPMDAAKLPGIIIYTKSEDSHVASMGSNALIEHDLEVAIEAYVKSNSGADDTIDTIQSEIETAIGASTAVQNLVKWIIPESVEVQLMGEGETAAVVGVFVFTARYVTREGAPDTIV